MREQRREAAHRQRRIIFNNDGDDVLAYAEEPTAEALLKVRTSPLLGSQADAVFYCTTQTFGMSLHNSRVTQIQTSREEVYAKNIVPDLIAQGTDALQIMVDFCHSNGMEAFWSMRMNDVHDGDPRYTYMFPRFKQEHPEYLLGTLENRPTAIRDSRIWAGVDYAQPAVRDMAFRTIEEVCQNYDVDGIELDFFRHPVFFKRHSWGEPLGQEELDMMTGLIQRVRKMTEDVSIGRGRPLLVAVRVPDSPDYCRGIGLDLPRWLEEALIDILVVNGYFQLSPCEDTVALSHEHGVPAYFSLDPSSLRDDARKVRNSIECYRARAMQCWHAGADGVYMFNLFNPNAPHWRELGDPQALAKLNKLYVLNPRGVRLANVYLPGGDRFATRPALCPERPVTLSRDEPCTVTLPVGDDVEWGKDQGIVPEITLSLQVENVPAADALLVMVNGEEAADGALAEGWLDYALIAALVRKGANRFEVALRAGGDDAAILKDLHLRIRYPQAP